MESNSKKLKDKIKLLKAHPDKKVGAEWLIKFFEPLASDFEFYECFCSQQPECKVEDAKGCEVAVN